MKPFVRFAYALGLKERLVLLVLLTVAPLIALLGWNAISERRIAMANAASAMTQSARMAAQRQSMALNEAVTVLNDMRSIPSLSVEGGDECRSQVVRLQQRHPGLNTIGVLRMDGVVVCHNILKSPRAAGHAELLADALRPDSREIYVSHFLHGPISGRPVIFVSKPLRSASGDKIGLLYVSIDLEAFSELADESSDHTRMMMVVEPDTGIVLARSANSGLRIGSMFPDGGLLVAMRDQPSGGHAEGRLEDHREIFGFAPLPGAETSGAMVVVGTPRVVALAQANWQSMTSFALALLATTLAVCSAWALGYLGQVRPARQLAAVAERIGQGDLTFCSELEPWQAPEFRRLGDTLDQMATRLQEANEELKSSESRYRLLAENAADLVTRTDASGKRVYASPSSRALLGYEPEELIGKNPINIAHPSDRAQLAVMLDTLQRGEPADAVQYRMRRRDGNYIWVETNGRPLGKGQGIVCSVRDISQRKCVEDKLEEANRNLLLLASTDGLTGLANRRAFDKALPREIARCARDASPIVLLLIDVDYFKSYNDSYGHQEGDECLKRVSHLLRNLARRPGDVAARYGGEEFAIVLPNTTLDGGRRFAEHLRMAVEDMRIPHCRSAFEVVTVSVGLACEMPVAGVESGIVAKADAALYAAKENGRNRVEFYTSDTQAIETRRYGA